MTVIARMHSELDLLMVTVHDGMCMLKVSTKRSTNIIIPHTALILSPSGKILGYIKYFTLAAGHETSPTSLCVCAEYRTRTAVQTLRSHLKIRCEKTQFTL